MIVCKLLITCIVCSSITGQVNLSFPGTFCNHVWNDREEAQVTDSRGGSLDCIDWHHAATVLRIYPKPSQHARVGTLRNK